MLNVMNANVMPTINPIANDFQLLVDFTLSIGIGKSSVILFFLHFISTQNP